MSRIGSEKTTSLVIEICIMDEGLLDSQYECIENCSVTEEKTPHQDAVVKHFALWSFCWFLWVPFAHGVILGPKIVPKHFPSNI